jgi:hypothetical protein
VTPTIALSPTNYGACTGTWFVWAPVIQMKGDGAFAVDQSTRAANFTDGMSNTMGMAEVKAYLGIIHDGLNPDVLNFAVPREQSCDLGIVDLGGIHGHLAGEFQGRPFGVRQVPTVASRL